MGSFRSRSILCADSLFQDFPRLYCPVGSARFRRVLGPGINLIDEDKAIPDMTLEALKKMKLPGFPKGAGWYFQQLLKFSFCHRQQENDYYLIWDAWTLFRLRPLEFFKHDGRMLFTIAEEEHVPYLETYSKALEGGGTDAGIFFHFAAHDCAEIDLA